MKIWLLSDIHFEVTSIEKLEQIYIPEIPIDVVVFAGDISLYHDVFKRINDILDKYNAKHKHYPQVVYVPGNHEYYGYEIDKVNQYLDSVFEFSPIFYLNIDNPTVVINDVAFIGNTLWAKGADNPIAEMTLQSAISDFRYISVGDYTFTPTDMNIMNKNMSSQIERQLETFQNYKTVVVTHHLPSFQCISERFKGLLLNDAFASEQDELIEKYKPDLWLFGHTHDYVDTYIFSTRCVAAPLGYESKIYNGRVIEI